MNISYHAPVSLCVFFLSHPLFFRSFPCLNLLPTVPGIVRSLIDA
jgi:hypothetical protein